MLVGTIPNIFMYFLLEVDVSNYFSTIDSVFNLQSILYIWSKDKQFNVLLMFYNDFKRRVNVTIQNHIFSNH